MSCCPSTTSTATHTSKCYHREDCVLASMPLSPCFGPQEASLTLKPPPSLLPPHCTRVSPSSHCIPFLNSTFQRQDPRFPPPVFLFIFSAFTTSCPPALKMVFRPCIDLHAGKVKQIVGSSLTGNDAALVTNFEATMSAEDFAK